MDKLTMLMMLGSFASNLTQPCTHLKAKDRKSSFGGLCVCATVEVIIEIDRYVLLHWLKGERSVTAEQMPNRVIDEEPCSAWIIELVNWSE